MPYTSERLAAERAARAAADAIRPHAGGLDARHVRAKDTHDLVTFVDEAAQAAVLAVLADAFPADAVLAEEGSAADGPATVPTEGRCWVVDPLDGTTNFAHGVPPYAVSVALYDGGQGVVGVVLDVSSGEMFAATRGGGLTVTAPDGRARPGRVSETAALDDALLATGFPFRDYRYAEGYLATFERAMRSTRGVRRHGAAAVDLAWTAAGRFDGFFEAGLAPWDSAAGVVLVEAAGGRVAGLWDGADAVRTGGLVAAGPSLFADVKALAEPLGAAYRAALNSAPTDR